VGIKDESHDLIPGHRVSYTHPDLPNHENYEAQVSDDQVQRDANTLGRNELRRRYPLTFNAYHNMCGRRRAGLAKIAPEFAKFDNFLAIMGPRRRSDLTLDRLNNENLEYGPGLCAWVSKKEQARNRSSTRRLHNEVTGETRPLTEWAEMLNIKPDTIRRRLRDGWSETEALLGYRRDKSQNRWPWDLDPTKLQLWEDAYRGERKLQSDDGYEFRYEYAIRRLLEIQQNIATELAETAESYGLGHGVGSELLPPDIRSKFDSNVEHQTKAAARLAAAYRFEELNRAEIATWRRDRPKRRNNREDEY
jgi:hypothetical protein